MFQRIVVAVDGSDTALRAVDKAVQLQRLLPEAEILLICVYKHHSLFEASLSIGRPVEMDIPDKVLSEYAREVVNFAKTHARERGATHLRGFVRGGRPSKIIVKFAREKEADLIVVGTRGTHSDKEGMLLGSVSHRVTSAAKCPVLVV